jgi:6-pyruvoyltetrahydropterin/6-carboxytetrahydropterin synthase
MLTATKVFAEYPFAHRQHNHPGHCHLIHGHNWTFTFVFGAATTDACGFVVDFGDLKWMKEALDSMFDHTLVLNRDDPALNYLNNGLVNPTGAPEGVLAAFFPFARITVVPDGSCEGLASFLYDTFNPLLKDRTDGRAWIQRLIVSENSRNSATYTP